MQHPLRITKNRIIFKGTSRYSFVAHLKIILRNIRMIFTNELLSSGNTPSVQVLPVKTEKIYDKVLISTNEGDVKFIDCTDELASDSFGLQITTHE